MTALTLTAKSPRLCRIEGATHYTLFASDGFGYSFGQLKQCVVGADGIESWLPYCIGNRAIGLHELNCPTFTSRGDALAWVRQQYEAALSRRSAIAAEVFGILLNFGGLSPIREVSPGYGQQGSVVMGIISTNNGQGYIEIDVTPQEALTALDHLHSRSDGRFVPTIVGRRSAPDARVGFAEWTIPYGSRDYHVMGWRSTTGAGRPAQQAA